jgi:hypothetical protein
VLVLQYLCATQITRPHHCPVQALKRGPSTPSTSCLAAHAQGTKLKRRLEKSEFIEAEAQESDDDEMLGFGDRRNNADEEDGEDLERRWKRW